MAKAHSMIFFAVSVCPHSKAVSTRSTTLRRYPTQFVISFSANDGDAAMRLMIAAGNSSGYCPSDSRTDEVISLPLSA